MPSGYGSLSRGDEPGLLPSEAKRGERTAEALAAILPELHRRGYRVVTLSELVDYS